MSLFFVSSYHGPLSPTFCHLWISKTDLCNSKAVGLRWGRYISEKGEQRLRCSQWEKKNEGKSKKLGQWQRWQTKHTLMHTHADERQTWQWFLSFPSCCSLPTPETLPQFVIAMLVLACMSRWCWPAISLGRWAKWSDYSNDRCTHLSNSSACLPAHFETTFMKKVIGIRTHSWRWLRVCKLHLYFSRFYVAKTLLLYCILLLQMYNFLLPFILPFLLSLTSHFCLAFLEIWSCNIVIVVWWLMAQLYCNRPTLIMNILKM